jgi:hypothetical protein
MVWERVKTKQTKKQEQRNKTRQTSLYVLLRRHMNVCWVLVKYLTFSSHLWPFEICLWLHQCIWYWFSLGAAWTCGLAMDATVTVSGAGLLGQSSIREHGSKQVLLLSSVTLLVGVDFYLCQWCCMGRSTVVLLRREASLSTVHFPVAETPNFTDGAASGSCSLSKWGRQEL